MSNHTSFRIGGPADIFCLPRSAEEVESALRLARENGLPCYVIGDGANILVADKGIRGVVISLKGLTAFSFSQDLICSAEAGVPVSGLAEEAAAREYSGIEFLYALPGTLGGAVFMNARCYGTSISDVLVSVEYLAEDLEIRSIAGTDCGFDYKRSIFQQNGGTILRAVLRLEMGKKEDILDKMEQYKEDREKKGHFTHPSAGSAFKNNREFGKPSGQLIDSLGLKGFGIGGARISPEHANIVVNTGNATAREVKRLLELIKKKVYDAYGFELEEEIRFLGEWGG